MKMVLTINYSSIVATQFVVRHGGNLIERAKLALEKQALRIQI